MKKKLLTKQTIPHTLNINELYIYSTIKNEPETPSAVKKTQAVGGFKSQCWEREESLVEYVETVKIVDLTDKSRHEIYYADCTERRHNVSNYQQSFNT